MFRLQLCFLMSLGVSGCKIYTDNLLLRYSFYNANSQIVEDVSGNQFHGTNGSNLTVESSDVTWTDRGGYFSGDQHILVASNAITDKLFSFSMNFTMTAWVYSLDKSGYIAGKSQELGMLYGEKGVCFIFGGSFQHQLPSSPYTGKNYIDNWRIVSIVFSYTPSLQTLGGFYMDSLVAKFTLSSWTDSQSYPFLVGKNNKNFQGFIYDLLIYDEDVITSHFSDGTIYTKGLALDTCDGYPLSESQCLSTCLDPLKDKSCNNCSGTCQECDSGCGAYCSTTDPSDCVDIRNTFCKPSPYDTVILECNFSIICIANCYHCTNNTQCLQCESSFFLQPDLTCDSSCSPGYFADSASGNCLLCHGDCATCTGSLDSNCLTCTETNAFAQSGTCVCKDRFFASSSNPLVCSPCYVNCSTCDGSSYSDCLSCIEGNWTLQDGACRCGEGSFESDIGTCEACTSNCLECSATACTKCSESFTLEHGTCVCPDVGQVYNEICYELFSIEIIYSSFKVLKLKSQEPLEGFESADLSIQMIEPEALEVSFLLSQASSTNYTLDLSLSDSFRLKNITLYIQFSYPYFSPTGRLLEKMNETRNYFDERPEEHPEELTEIGIAGVFSLGGALVAGLVSMITLEEPSVLWTVAYTSQFISYLPLIEVDLSLEAKQFLTSYQSFYFFPNPVLMIIDKTDAKPPSYYTEYGKSHEEYEDIHILRNAGRFLSIIALAIGLHGILLGCMLCLKGNCRTKAKNRLNKFPSIMMRLFILMYLDLAISGIVELMDLGSSNYFVSALVTLAVAFLLVLVPSYILLSLAAASLDSEHVIFLKNTMTDLRSDSKLALSFYGLLCLRNLAFAGCLYFLRDYPDHVVGLQAAISALVMISFLKFKYFANGIGNFIHGLGELVLFLTLLSFCAIRYATYIYLDSVWAEYFLIGLNMCFILGGTLMKTVQIFTVVRSNRKKTKVRNITSDDNSEDNLKVFARRENMMRAYSFIDQFSSIDNSNSINIREILSSQVNQY